MNRECNVVRAFLVPSGRLIIMWICALLDEDSKQPFRFASDFAGMPALGICNGFAAWAVARNDGGPLMSRKKSLKLGVAVMLCKLGLDLKIGPRTLDTLNWYEASTYPTMIPVTYSLARKLPALVEERGWASALALLFFAAFVGTFVWDEAH